MYPNWDVFVQPIPRKDKNLKIEARVRTELEKCFFISLLYTGLRLGIKQVATLLYFSIEGHFLKELYTNSVKLMTKKDLTKTSPKSYSLFEKESSNKEQDMSIMAENGHIAYQDFIRLDIYLLNHYLGVKTLRVI